MKHNHSWGASCQLGFAQLKGLGLLFAPQKQTLREVMCILMMATTMHSRPSSPRTGKESK